MWIAGLPFIPQVIIVLAVVIPLSFGIAWLLDRALIGALTLLGRGAEPMPSGAGAESREGGR